jgi:cytoskeletal protein RodZ
VELIETERTTAPALPEPEPRYHTASLPIEKTEHGQSLLRTLAAILVGLILIVLIVLLARWIYHKTHHAVTPTPATSSQQSAASSSAKNESGAQPAPSQSAGTSSNPSTPATGSSSGTKQITNTGPGETAAIFVGASLAAAGLHYIVTVRRFSKTGT